MSIYIHANIYEFISFYICVKIFAYHLKNFVVICLSKHHHDYIDRWASMPALYGPAVQGAFELISSAYLALSGTDNPV
jgi:hypothetical protein